MSVTPGVESMDESEVMNFIKDSKAGVLTLVDSARPYGVPVEHYFDGKEPIFRDKFDNR
jgi:nitroimidazol reductase NimA-like FMN-containing flavoprotein (pyridoxamine 5'-phosphate oxidase superfamily)